MKNSIILLSFCFLLIFDVYAHPPVRLKKVLVSRYTTTGSGYTPWDSTVYCYSGSNKGYLDNNFFFNSTLQDVHGISNPRVYFYADFSPNLMFSPGLQYDSAIKYRLSHPGSPKYAAASQEITNNNVTKLTTGLHNYLINKWHYYWTSVFSYSGGMIISHIDSGKHGSGTVQNNYYYNNSGFPDSIVTTAANGSKQKITYIYSNGLLIERTNNASNGNSHKTIYNYLNGLLAGQILLSFDNISGMWDTVGGTNLSYNSGSQLIHERRWGDSGKTWLTIDISYDNNNNRVEDIIHCDYNQNGQNTGLMKTVKKQYWYNSFGLITDFEVLHWDDINQTWGLGADSLFGTSQKVHLEYEVYWPQDVVKLNNSPEDFTLFPSPASGFITVKAEGMSGGTLEGIIYDLQGRILRKWADESGDVYTATIPVHDLPAGSYILQLKDNEKNRRGKFVIYR